MKIEKIWAELSAKAQEVAQESTELSAEEVKLSMMQDADALYKQLVNVAQSQVSILFNVEKVLSKNAATAKELLAMEQKLESMAEELGVDLNLNYYASEWVEAMEKYSREVGDIASLL